MKTNFKGTFFFFFKEVPKLVAPKAKRTAELFQIETGVPKKLLSIY